MFYVKDSKKSVTAIEAVVSIQGKKFKYATGVSVATEFWKQDEHRAKYSRKYADGKKINERLEELQEVITDVAEWYKWKVLPSPAEFRKRIDVKLNGEKTDAIRLIDFINDFHTGRDYKPETRKKYVTAINKLTDFEGSSRSKVYLQDIDIDFYYRFRTWFYEQVKPQKKDSTHTPIPYSKNYFGSIVKVLKKVLKYADENGLYKNDVYKHSEFVVEMEEADTVALSVDELLKIHRFTATAENVQAICEDKRVENLKRKAAALNLTKNKFLIGAFTALRVSDFNRLREVNIRDNMIRIKPRKGVAKNQDVVIPIHRVICEILADGFNIDAAVSDVKINKHIKEVCRLVGIDDKVVVVRTEGGRMKERVYKKYELVCTHTARRSGATNMVKAGIPAVKVMVITNHKTWKSFMKYIKITQEENAEDLAGHPFFS